MSEEILVNVTPHETRVATVEDGVLQELSVERTGAPSLVGSIIKGCVYRVLPGMQSAFIDVGLERTGFLHFADLHGAAPFRAPNASQSGADVSHAPLREGQELLVQTLKDPVGAKGARLTTRISIASRYLALVPGQEQVMVSQRIKDPAERERLCRVIARHSPDLREYGGGAAEPGRRHNAAPGATGKGVGFIVRTMAAAATEHEIQRDMEFLRELWQSIMERVGQIPAPGIIHKDLPLALRAMRDNARGETMRVLVDCETTCRRAQAFCERFIPRLHGKVERYSEQRPILDLYSVEDELEKILARETPLKCGGYLIIDRTEAMTTIDVNTGAHIGHKNLQDTIYRTNLEAAQAIARQLRLRNLGGIIIVDFIDMRNQEHARQVLRSLEKHLERDSARTTISDFTSLGLVQITRKRTRESLEQTLCEPCPSCNGRGVAKTLETVCYEIFREIRRKVRQFDGNRLLVMAAQPVVERLQEKQAADLTLLEETTGCPIKLQAEAQYQGNQYDIILL